MMCVCVCMCVGGRHAESICRFVVHTCLAYCTWQVLVYWVQVQAHCGGGGGGRSGGGVDGCGDRLCLHIDIDGKCWLNGCVGKHIVMVMVWCWRLW